MREQVDKYLQEGKYIYIFIISLLLINLFVNLIGIKPRWVEADRMRMEYLSLREDESRLRLEMNEKVKLAESIRQARLDLKEFISSLFPDSKIAKIRSELYRNARKSGISISSLKYSLPEYKDDELVKYNISFPISGSYRKIRKFIHKLEKLPYLMSINDLAISSSKEGKVSVTIRISIYLKAGEE